ncbi:MAG: ribosome silencing factor [Flavobacteriales bacterium]|nr:ribosome silencing factor [Flavobacteriales bacterium]
MKKSTVTDSDILLDAVVKGLEDVKGYEITIIDLREIHNSIAAYFIVCHGNSHTQVEALTASVEKVVFEAIGEKPVSVQGVRTGVWAIVDYFDIVVHVFHKDARSRFALEELWGDANITKHEYAEDELINNAEL